MKEIDDNLSKECKEAVDELTTKLNEGDEGHLEILCLKYPDCEYTLREVHEAWKKLDDMAVPAAMPDRRERFYSMLSDFESEVNQQQEKTIPVRKLYPAMKWAAVLILGIFIGVFASNYRNEAGPTSSPGLLPSHLTSLESESSIERLTALQTIKEIESPEDQVFEAMFQTLTNDPNVNVRLSTIKTMLHFADQPKARTMLIRALAFQDSPIVQLTLAEVIIKLQEEGALEELKKALETNQFDREVKKHIEETLNTL